jgi:hypothetical protein
VVHLKPAPDDPFERAILPSPNVVQDDTGTHEEYEIEEILDSLSLAGNTNANNILSNGKDTGRRIINGWNKMTWGMRRNCWNPTRVGMHSRQSPRLPFLFAKDLFGLPTYLHPALLDQLKRIAMGVLIPVPPHLLQHVHRFDAVSDASLTRRTYDLSPRCFIHHPLFVYSLSLMSRSVRYSRYIACFRYTSMFSLHILHGEVAFFLFVGTVTG